MNKKHFATALVTGMAALTMHSASAAFINFDTDQSGTPYTGPSDSFVADEYTGVIINDSDPTAGSTFVNETSDLNDEKTSVNGFYVNVGAFAGVDTEVTLDFTSAVNRVDFVFANPTGYVSVEAFDGGGGSLGVFEFYGTESFINQAGFEVLAGGAGILGVGAIASMSIKPNSKEALILDNLVFKPVPIPAALPLFLSGLLGLGFLRRRR